MNTKISNGDKHNLQTLMFIAIFTGVCIAIFIGTRYVPLKWIAIVTVAIEMFFLMPKVCDMYYEMNEVAIGYQKYVPGLNIVQVFSPVIAKIATVMIVILVLIALAMFIPLELVESVLGEQVALMYTGRCFVFLIVGFLIFSVIVGAGYCGVLQNISARLFDLYGIRLGGTTWLWRIFLFIPIIRVCGLTFIYTQLNSLRASNYGNNKEYTDEFYEEEM